MKNQCLAAAFVLAGFAGLSRAQVVAPEVKKEAAAPPDAAVVELDLPTEAKATIDGKEVGDSRTFQFGGLEQRKWRDVKLAGSFADGSKFERTIVLKGGWRVAPGENRIEVKAASADGSWESEPAAVVLKRQKAVAKVGLHVLACGINKDAESSLNLKYATADAKAMGDLFGAVRVYNLLDADATQSRIRETVKSIAAEAKPEDVLVVFLVGHGTTLGQRYYYVTHEFRRTDAATVDEDIRKQALAGDVLASWLEEVKATKRVVIFARASPARRLA